MILRLRGVLLIVKRSGVGLRRGLGLGVRGSVAGGSGGCQRAGLCGGISKRLGAVMFFTRPAFALSPQLVDRKFNLPPLLPSFGGGGFFVVAAFA